MPSPHQSVRIAPGFPDPVVGAQLTFRGVLEAMANPGRIVRLEPSLTPPPPLHPAAAAIVLALVDYETPLWLDAAAATDLSAAYLRFHTGTTLVGHREQAAFALFAGGIDTLAGFALGTDQYPESAATLVIQVNGLSARGPLTLTGPGIESARSLAVEGLPAGLWAERAGLRRAFPRGLDLILTDGEKVCALPRTTAIAVPDDGSRPCT